MEDNNNNISLKGKWIKAPAAYPPKSLGTPLPVRKLPSGRIQFGIKLPDGTDFTMSKPPFNLFNTPEWQKQKQVMEKREREIVESKRIKKGDIRNFFK